MDRKSEKTSIKIPIKMLLYKEIIDCYSQSLEHIMNDDSPYRKIGNELQNQQCNQENKKES